MRDGSDAIADWPILNALVNTAAGATWVSFHHGGGVGIGYSLHAGMVVVADGTPEAAARLERVLTSDPGMGVLRHADAGYERALEVARRTRPADPDGPGRLMDAAADLSKLGHIGVAMAMIGGLVGSFSSVIDACAPAPRTLDPADRAAAARTRSAPRRCSEASAPFEMTVQVSSRLVVVVGLADRLGAGLPVARPDDGLDARRVLLSSRHRDVPAIFIPRGRRLRGRRRPARGKGSSPRHSVPPSPIRPLPPPVASCRPSRSSWRSWSSSRF